MSHAKYRRIETRKPLQDAHCDECDGPITRIWYEDRLGKRICQLCYHEMVADSYD